MPEQMWYCVQCSEVLGTTVANELTTNPGVVVSTRGANLLVNCPKCFAQKVWYPNDQIVRAVYQMIDAFASVAVARMVRKQSP